MKYRVLGKTGLKVSEISFGAWAVGGSWGKVDDETSIASMRKFIELGGNFIDTADVYGDGRSERLTGQIVRETGHPVYVATKFGRGGDGPHSSANYTKSALHRFVECSLNNLRLEAIDLYQLHCPPHEVIRNGEIFGHLDQLAKQGKIRHYGVSIERVEEALDAIEYSGISTVQIIFNMFRQKPILSFLTAAKKANIGIIARVPLASGLLAGKMNRNSIFPSDDHRNFNREGAAFNRGETFSGVDFKKGLAAVEEIRKLVPSTLSMTQFALRWILEFQEVSCAIPGGKTPAQVEENMKASNADRIPVEVMKKIQLIYRKYFFKEMEEKY